MTRPGEVLAAGHREVLALRSGDDVVRTRHRVREIATALGYDLVSQTKVVTAASELARNTVLHGGGGELELAVLAAPDGTARLGLAMTFTDHGPGIADVEKAMTGGWSSGGGLGLGLPGSRRLVHDFELESHVGLGTRVRAVMWRRAR